MLLRKRQRGPMRRTTSMTGINVDLGHVDAMEPSDPSRDSLMNGQGNLESQGDHARTNVVAGGASGFDHRLMATVSPRYHKKSSGSGVVGGGGDNTAVIETAHFLRTCGLCKRRLAPGRDLYMYRGDTAFCSLECREKQMKHDEIKDKCSVAASNKDEKNHHHHHHQHHHHNSPTVTPTVTATTTAMATSEA